MSLVSEFVLRGAGKALPDDRIDNEQLGRLFGVAPESIFERTGVRERRIAPEGESASTLGARACEIALRAAEVDPQDLDLVLLSTYTPDRLLCPTAPELAHRIGAVRAGAFDVNAACSGGVTALITANSLLASGAFRNALVVASDLTTHYVRENDDKTRLVFGDGAAAMLLERPAAAAANRWSVLASIMGADGSGAEMFHVPSGGSRCPAINGHQQDAIRTVVMNGRAIFRFGVQRGADVVAELCGKAGVGMQEVDWVIPHQANLRIIQSLIDKLPIPRERWFVNIEHYGNTASASIPIALIELIESGKVKPGEVILLVAFGAGLTWSGLALRAG